MSDKDSTGADIKEVKADVKEVKADVKEVKGNVSSGMEKAELPLAPGGENVRPLTTAEEDRKTHGQRNVNLIWEITQAFIAIVITIATVYAALAGIDSQILGNAFVLVLTMYLIRTNHTKIGGIGGTDSNTR